MPRRGENIYKRQDGRWEARIKNGLKPNGRARYRSVYGKSYSEVKAKLIECQKQINQRNGSIPISEKLTVKNLLDEWLAGRLTLVKESSYLRYASLVEKHILPVLGPMPVVSLSEQSLNAFISEKLKHGRLDGKGGLSRKTVNDIVFVLKSALSRHNLPFDLWEVKTPHFRQPLVVTFTDSEIETIREAAKEDGSLSSMAYLLCLSTGLRLGEVCGLKWGDIDFAKKIFMVSRTVLRISSGGHTELVAQTPKTDFSERCIPLSNELSTYLAALRNGAPGDAFILTGLVGKPMEPRTLQYRFKAFLLAHHIPPRNFHVLRHSFASRCVSRGMDTKMLSRILGHANVKTTLQLYVHPTLEQMRRYMDSFHSPSPSAAKDDLPSDLWSA